MRLLFTIALLLGVVAPCALTHHADPAYFIPFTSLEEVEAGDKYDQTQPNVTDAQLFAGKKVAFVIGHGVEDIEVFYQHQYFTDRGAEVFFVCSNNDIANYGPEGKVILLDWSKSTYVSECTYTFHSQGLDLMEFDIVYVAGGVQSSALVRGDTVILQKLWKYYREGGAHRLLAFICSGTEVMIELGIVKRDMTGSPASRFFLELAGAAYRDVPYVYEPPTGTRTHLLTGKSPQEHNSFDFVNAIGFWFGELNEFEAAGTQTVINPAIFAPVADDFSNAPHGGQFDETQPTVQYDFSDVKVGIAASNGAQDLLVTYAHAFFHTHGADVHLLCPSWAKKVQLLDGARPVYHYPCEGFDTTKTWDILVITGGPWNTGVLRNDPDLSVLLFHHYAAGRLLIALDTGVEVLVPAGITHHGAHVTTSKLASKNAILGGAVFHDVPVLRDENLLTGRDGNSLRGVMEEAVKIWDELNSHDDGKHDDDDDDDDDDDNDGPSAESVAVFVVSSLVLVIAALLLFMAWKQRHRTRTLSSNDVSLRAPYEAMEAGEE